MAAEAASRTFPHRTGSPSRRRGTRLGGGTESSTGCGTRAPRRAERPSARALRHVSPAPNVGPPPPGRDSAGMRHAWYTVHGEYLLAVRPRRARRRRRADARRVTEDRAAPAQRHLPPNAGRGCVGAHRARSGCDFTWSRLPVAAGRLGHTRRECCGRSDICQQDGIDLCGATQSVITITILRMCRWCCPTTADTRRRATASGRPGSAAPGPTSTAPRGSGSDTARTVPRDMAGGPTP